MPSDPFKKYEKSKDDWYAKPAKRQKRKLTLLPHRKYVHFKGTMKRVKVPPVPATQCVVMRWMDGIPDATPTDYLEKEKLLILADSGIAYVFKSRSAAKKAIWHTCQYEKVPGGYVDFAIVNTIGDRP